MSETSEAPEKVTIQGVSWSDDPRIEITPKTVTIDIIGGYGPPENSAHESLEKNPENAPPDKVAIRRHLFGADLLKQDEFSSEGDHGVAAGMACALSGMSMRHFKRMNISDSRLVIQVVSGLLVGKG